MKEVGVGVGEVRRAVVVPPCDVPGLLEGPVLELLDRLQSDLDGEVGEDAAEVVERLWADLVCLDVLVHERAELVLLAELAVGWFTKDDRG